jgi:hypothetical protein
MKRLDYLFARDDVLSNFKQTNREGMTHKIQVQQQGPHHMTSQIFNFDGCALGAANVNKNNFSIRSSYRLTSMLQQAKIMK